jgi:hypothetical protein
MFTDDNASADAMPTAQRPPFTALPNWMRGRFTAEEIGLLWCLQSYYPDIRPSVGTLERETGISRRQLHRMLTVLDRDGVTVRRSRRRSDGGKTANGYGLRLWDEDASRTIRTGEKGGVCATQSHAPGATVTPPPCATQSHTHVPHSHIPCATVAHQEEEQGEEEQGLKKAIQQPYPPKSPPQGGSTPQAGPVLGFQTEEVPRRPQKAPEIDASPIGTQQPPERPSSATQQPLAVVADPSPTPVVEGADKPKAKRSAAARDPFASKTLPATAVPDDLLDCQQLLREWWSVKGKGRTQVSFDRACGLLRQQSPDDRRQMLTNAVIGAWQGLHEIQKGRGVSNGQGMGYGERRLTQNERSTLEAMAIVRGERPGFSIFRAP